MKTLIRTIIKVINLYRAYGGTSVLSYDDWSCHSSKIAYSHASSTTHQEWLHRNFRTLFSFEQSWV